MKYLLLCVVFFGCATSPKFVEYDEINADKVKKNTEFKVDNFKKVVFIKPKYRDDGESKTFPPFFDLHPYISVNESGHTNFLKVRFVGNSWLFMSELKINCNNKTITIKTPYSGATKDVLTGTLVTEEYHAVLTNKQLSDLSKCKKGDMARIYGKSAYSEKNIQSVELSFMKEVQILSDHYKSKNYSELIKEVQ